MTIIRPAQSKLYLEGIFEDIVRQLELREIPINSRRSDSAELRRGAESPIRTLWLNYTKNGYENRGGEEIYLLNRLISQETPHNPEFPKHETLHIVLRADSQILFHYINHYVKNAIERFSGYRNDPEKDITGKFMKRLAEQVVKRDGGDLYTMGQSIYLGKVFERPTEEVKKTMLDLVSKLIDDMSLKASPAI